MTSPDTSEINKTIQEVAELIVQQLLGEATRCIQSGDPNDTKGWAPPGPGQEGGLLNGLKLDRDAVWRQVYRGGYGQHDADWLSFYDFLWKEVGVEACARLEGLSQVAKSAGWWWPFKGAAIITERPHSLSVDGQGRLHHERGPALAYPDGFAMWSWHGTRVPRDLIEQGWDPARILREPNVEVRRCAIERIGWPTFVSQAGLKQVGSLEEDPGNPGCVISLYDLPEQVYDEPVRVLLCTNGSDERDGTRRQFGLTVPATMNDPVSAAAWTYGVTPELYRQLRRRK